MPSTLERVDWNAQGSCGDLRKAIAQLEAESGNGLHAGEDELPRALAELGWIGEYEFRVQPPSCHGRAPFAGLSKRST